MASNIIRSCASRALVSDQCTNPSDLESKHVSSNRLLVLYQIFNQLFNRSKVAFKPLSAAVNQVSAIHTSPVRSDIDSAAKYIGAGAATVGVAGAGKQKSFDTSPLRY